MWKTMGASVVLRICEWCDYSKNAMQIDLLEILWIYRVIKWWKLWKWETMDAAYVSKILSVSYNNKKQFIWIVRHHIIHIPYII